MEPAPTTYTGRCACGAVTYEVQGPPVVVAQCHCDECRRFSGTGHSVGAMFPARSVKLHGDTGEYTYRSGLGSEVTKGFCPACGSPIYGRNTRAPAHVTLTLGSMDDAGGLAVEVVIFARDTQDWDQLVEGAICFATQPDWHPDG